MKVLTDKLPKVYIILYVVAKRERERRRERELLSVVVLTCFLGECDRGGLFCVTVVSCCCTLFLELKEKYRCVHDSMETASLPHKVFSRANLFVIISVSYTHLTLPTRIRV